MTDNDPEPEPPAESPAEGAPPEPPRRRRKLPWLLLIGFAVALWTYAHWLPLLAHKLLPPAAPYFGYRLSLEQVVRCDLGGVELRGVNLQRTAPMGPLRRFRAEELRVEFTPGLLQGDLTELQELAGRAIRVEIRTDPASPETREEASPPGNWLAPFQTLPRVNLTDLAVTLNHGAGQDLHEVRRLSIDSQGAIELAGRTAGRTILATGTWQPLGLRELRLDVDGEPLLVETEVDLASAHYGQVALQAFLPIGESQQSVSAQLDGERLAWQASWKDLDLAALRARLPLEIPVDLHGRLNLKSEGHLPWADPMQTRATLSFRGQGLRHGALEFSGAEGQASLEQGVARIPTLDLRLTGGNYLLVQGAEFPVDDLDPEHWLETARAQVTVVVEDSQPLLAAFASGEGRPRNLVPHRLALDASLEGRTLQVREFGLLSDAGNVRLNSGQLTLGPERSIQVQVQGEARLQDLAAVGQLFGREDWAGALGGQLRIEGTYPQLGGWLNLSGKEVQLEGFALGELDLQLHTREPGAAIEVSRLQIAAPQGKVEGQLVITPGETLEVRIDSLALERREQVLTLTQPARVVLGPDSGSCELLALSGTGGSLQGQGSWAGADFDVRLDVRDLNPNLVNAVQDAVPLAMAGADGHLRVRRRGEELEFQSEGKVRGWVPDAWPHPIDARWSLAHGEGHLQVDAFEALQGERTLLALQGRCPLELAAEKPFGEGPLEGQLEVHLPLALVQEEAQGILHLAGTVAGTWRALEGSLDLVGRDLRLSPNWHPAALESGRIQGQIRLGQGVSLENASLRFGDWIDTAVQLTGDLPLNLPLWLDSPEQAREASTIQSRLDIASLDVERLRPVLLGLSDSFAVLREGQLAGDLRVRGPLGALETEGSLKLVEGRVRPGGGLPPVEELRGDLQLQQDRVLVRELRGTLGAAPFFIGGEVLLSGDSPTMSLTLKGEDLLLLRNPDARVRANTSLQVSGPLDELLVQGELELTTGNYSPQLDFLNLRPGPQSSSAQGFQLFTFREPPLRDMAFDIQLTALSPFAIHNSILNGDIRPRLHLGGTGLLPVLNGTVYMEPTRLKLPVAQLDITGGTLRFLEENPFVPQLNIQGQTRQLGYDIRADISGPYDDPELLLSSTPPLSQEDLFLLLLTGRLPEDPNRTDLLSTANTVALYLARDAVSRWFAEDGPLNEDSLVERLEFAIGQDVSKNGSETFEVAVRVTDRMGKPPELKNARHAYLVAERDKYEDYNYGLRWVFRFKR